MTSPILRTGSTSASGRLLGVGIDIVRVGRVSNLLSQRIYTAREREVFAGRLELPFAGREAALKAVGVASILGLPLDQMPLDRTPDGLVFAPGTRFTEIMRAHGVDLVTLAEQRIDDAHLAITAMAWGPRNEGISARPVDALARPDGAAIRWACVMIRVNDADACVLSAAERAFAATRKKPSESIATRHAARIAIGALEETSPPSPLSTANGRGREGEEKERENEKENQDSPGGTTGIHRFPFPLSSASVCGGEGDRGGEVSPAGGWIEIAGGGDVAPWIVGLPGAFLSLTHESNVAAAMVAIDPVRQRSLR